MVPTYCTTGVYSGGATVNYPVAYMAVYDSASSKLGSKYYLDQFHRPILVSSAVNSA